MPLPLAARANTLLLLLPAVSLGRSHHVGHLKPDHQTDLLCCKCCMPTVTRALWLQIRYNAFKLHLPRIHDYLWVAEDGMTTKALLELRKCPRHQLGEVP
ncbi:hypothetical protein E2562_030721 [Oryza meyeriana var. granulata]|uniref:Secreted protein n=1 Tax=Oryza meyeriana var. granulata TaxID=110450 RepID=A0A6G1CTP4_9ORYZ|nr:hypothetical protein E2562_030721 [Oryza meyeriana var. granulata]